MQSFGVMVEGLTEGKWCFLIFTWRTGMCACVGREVMGQRHEVMESYDSGKQIEPCPDFCTSRSSKALCSSTASQNTQVPTCRPITEEH